MSTDQTASRRGSPPAGERLSRPVIVRRAARLIEMNGMASFSLRALAADLGVRPSALYNHVRNLDDLLSDVVAHALTELDLTDEAATWSEWLRTVALDVHHWLLARPETAGLILSRTAVTADDSELLNRVADRLAAASVDRTVAHIAWHVLITVVAGAVLQELRPAHDRDHTFEAVLDVTLAGILALSEAPVDPRLRQLVRSHGYSDR